MKKIIKTAFIKSLPVLAGYLVIGFGFGMICEKNGYGFLWTLAMSLFIYAGSMQYVTISLLTSNASLLTAFFTTLMVNARHLFYGISMVEHYKGSGKYKPYLIFGLTDETYSLVCTGEAPNGLDFHKYSVWVTIFNHFYWIIGSVLGVLVGTILKINTTGVEFSMTALFITVFVEQWRRTKNHTPAIIGLFATLVCLVIFGSDNFLIFSMIFISILLILFKKKIEYKEDN